MNPSPLEGRLTPLQNVVINLVAFNGLWLLLVSQRSPVATGVALAWIALHFALFARQGEPRRVASVMLVGVIIDGLLTRYGVFAFTPEVPWLPAWLVLLWAAFGTTLEHSMAWALKTAWVAGLLGAVAGPFSYLVGYRLGAVELPMGVFVSALILAAIWGGLLFTASTLYSRFQWLPKR